MDGCSSGELYLVESTRSRLSFMGMYLTEMMSVLLKPNHIETFLDSFNIIIENQNRIAVIRLYNVQHALVELPDYPGKNMSNFCIEPK